MSELLVQVVIWTGVMATAYAGPFVGQPLYCDRGDGLIYDESTTPWVALDVSEYQSGRAQCGDQILVRFEDGSQLQALALDAGPLYPHYIAHTGRPIAVDIPAHLFTQPGISAPATVINVSASQRAIEKEAGQ
jgi:hypothetical protein